VKHLNQTSEKQRLNFKEPLFSRSSNNAKSRRLTTLELRLTRRSQLLIKLRGFRTNPDRRSDQKRQTVFGFQLFGLKEIASELQKVSTKKHYSYTPIVANGMITLGAVGFIIGMGLTTSAVLSSPAPVPAPPIVVEPSVKTLPVVEADDEYYAESIPTNVSVPSLGIDAEVIQVGLLDDGSLETPGIFSEQAGWYKYGPTPGEQGPAVIAGHVDTYKGPSIFWNLSQAEIGESIYIQRQDGNDVEFNVTRVESYRQDSFLTEEVYSNIDHAGLRLITCGGSFNPLSGRYSHNTVVFAQMVKR